MLITCNHSQSSPATPTKTQTKKNKIMKITIRHTQASIDPSATYSDEQFPEVREALENEYSAALLKRFPDAEIEFEVSDDAHALAVSDYDDADGDLEIEVQRILELVFETGSFWL